MTMPQNPFDEPSSEKEEISKKTEELELSSTPNSFQESENEIKNPSDEISEKLETKKSNLENLVIFGVLGGLLLIMLIAIFLVWKASNKVLMEAPINQQESQVFDTFPTSKPGEDIPREIPNQLPKNLDENGIEFLPLHHPCCNKPENSPPGMFEKICSHREFECVEFGDPRLSKNEAKPVHPCCTLAPDSPESLRRSCAIKKVRCDHSRSNKNEEPPVHPCCTITPDSSESLKRSCAIKDVDCPIPSNPIPKPLEENGEITDREDHPCCHPDKMPPEIFEDMCLNEEFQCAPTIKQELPPSEEEGKIIFFGKTKEECRDIKMKCPNNFEKFRDDRGCGCKEITDLLADMPPVELGQRRIPPMPPIISRPPIGVPFPKPSITPPIFNQEAKSTWGDTLNSKNEIPENKFKVFYINTKNPKKVVKEDIVEKVAMNYAWSDFGIKSEDFGAYYVGNFKFEEPTTWDFEIDQGWSKTRIIVDKKIIYKGGSDATVSHTFETGTHKIEVEYINNWHTVGYTVRMGEKIKVYNIKTIRQELKDILSNKDINLWYTGVYESKSSDNSISVKLQKSTKPTILFLSSYSQVSWNIIASETNLKAIVYSAYAPGSEIFVKNKEVKIFKLNRREGLPAVYRLTPTCYESDPMYHCEGKDQFKKLLTTVLGITDKVLTGFTGQYGANELSTPDTDLTPQKLKEIAKKIKQIEARQAQARRGQGFEDMFDSFQNPIQIQKETMRMSGIDPLGTACKDDGDDFIDGGEGTDTVIFSGKRAEYEITQNSDGSYSVQDIIPCRNGNDKVINVELFKFSDGVVKVEDLVSD